MDVEVSGLVDGWREVGGSARLPADQAAEVGRALVELAGRGCVVVDARGVLQYVTPVPGGVGPVEMATLLERCVMAVIGPDVPSWRYRGLPYQPREDFHDQP